MICGHCSTKGVSVDHVRVCYSNETSIRTIGAPERAVPAVPASEEGFYYVPTTGAYYKVIPNQSGYLYAKVWDADLERWEYAPGVFKTLLASQKCDEHTAGLFGDLYNRCVYCSTRLTNEDPGCSVGRGYGPVCAEKYGLPWGPDAPSARKVSA